MGKKYRKKEFEKRKKLGFSSSESTRGKKKRNLSGKKLRKALKSFKYKKKKKKE